MAKAQSSAGEHMAHATGVVRAARWPDMPKAGKLRSDGPDAATLARFRRLASQPASFGYHFDGNRPAAFAASYGGPLPIPRMSKLCHQACLFKLRNRPEECLQEYACRNSPRTDAPQRSGYIETCPGTGDSIGRRPAKRARSGSHRSSPGGASEVRWVENAWAGEAQFSS
jgi:hypothetical protein